MLNGQSQVAQAIREIPGAEPLKLAPSLRGDKRVAVRFNLEARKASDEVVHEDYSKKFEASDNLKWSLSGDTVAGNQQPLGKSAAPATPVASGGSEDFDVIVVGAGVGGMGAGQTLRLLGLRAVVLEARDRIGGRCFCDRKRSIRPSSLMLSFPETIPQIPETISQSVTPTA